MPVSRFDFLRAAQVLGLPPNGSFGIDDVHRQYRKVMQAWHPDHNQEWRDEADAFTKEINAAKELMLNWLKDGKPDLRSGSGQASSRPGASPAGAGANTERPPPQPTAPSPDKPSIKEWMFSFYWRAGFLPHWRILILPAVIAAVMVLGPFHRHEAQPGNDVRRPLPLPAASAPALSGPEITSTKRGWTVIRYHMVRYPAWLPELQALTSKYPLPLTVVMEKHDADVVWEILVQKIDRLYELGKISAYPVNIRDAISNDMRSVVSQGAAILECRYATDITGDQFKIFYYWYQFRPAEADPAHARSIVPDHPLLSLRAPRYNCPERRRDAEDSP